MTHSPIYSDYQQQVQFLKQVASKLSAKKLVQTKWNAFDGKKLLQTVFYALDVGAFLMELAICWQNEQPPVKVNAQLPFCVSECGSCLIPVCATAPCQGTCRKQIFLVIKSLLRHIYGVSQKSNSPIIFLQIKIDRFALG